ncbi:MAG: peptide ABC transporter substrate-binding protein [Planctomycetota bacterium]
MLLRDRIKTCLLTMALLFPIGLGFYSGFSSNLGQADFVFVNQGEVSSLDPALASGIPEGRILMAVSEGLTSLHPHKLEPIPGCASSWNLSEAGKVVTFHLRQDLVWSNGQPLNAHDFVFSWRRLLDPLIASPYAYLLWDVEGAHEYTESRTQAGQTVQARLMDGSIVNGRLMSKDELVIRIASTSQGLEKQNTIPTREVAELIPSAESLGISAPDSLTLQVRLKQACPYFPLLTAFYPLFPVYADPASGRVDITINNGPFLVSARRLKDRIRLARNPFYWDAGQVHLDTIDALAITSPMTALNLYSTGTVDWINNVPPIVLPFVRDREDFSLTPNLGTNFLRLNVTIPPLDREKVRLALHLAIDNSAIIDYVLKGGQLVATSFVPPGIPGYTPPVIDSFDPEKARRLLAEEGFPQGKWLP